MRALHVTFFGLCVFIRGLTATYSEGSDTGLPEGVVARLGHPVYSSRHQAVAIAFSADDRLLACAGLRPQGFRLPAAKYPIEIYSTQAMSRVVVLEGAASPITMLKFASSGDQVVSADADGVLYLWDMTFGDCLWATSALNAKEVAFSADERIIFATDQASKLWVVNRDDGAITGQHDLSIAKDLGAPTPVAEGESHGVSADSSGDNRTIRYSFSREDGTMTIIEPGKAPVKVNVRAMARQMMYRRRLVLLPDGKNAAWLSDDGEFQIRDVRTGAIASDGELEKGIAIFQKLSDRDEEPSPVGLLWPASDPLSIQVRVADTVSSIDLAGREAEKTLFSWPPPTSWLTGDYSLSPDVPPGRPRGEGQFKMAWGADSLAVAPDGTRAALMGRRDANRSEIRVLDLDRGTTIRTFAIESRYCERALFRGQVSTGEQIRALKPVTGVFAHSGRKLAVEMFGEIRLLDLATGQEIVGDNRVGEGDAILQEHEDKIAAIVFSPDGRFVATASFDSTIRLWEVSTGRELLRREHSWANATAYVVAFSPDSSLLAADVGNKVEVMRCPTAEPVCTLSGKSVSSAAGHASSIGFSDDGKRMATFNPTLRELDWWEIPSGRHLETRKFEIHPDDKPKAGPTHTDDGSSRGFAFSPDMRRVAVPVYLDRVQLQFDTQTGERLHKATSAGYLAGPCFTSDRKQFVLGGDGEPFRLFSTDSDTLVQTIVPAGRHRDELAGYWMNPHADNRLGLGAGSGAEQPCAFLDRDRVLVTRDLWGSRFYNIESGAVFAELPNYAVYAVSKDGRLAATATARYVSSVHGDILTTASTILIWDSQRLLKAAERVEGTHDTSGGSFSLE